VNSTLPRRAFLVQTLGAMGALLAPSPIFGLLSKDGLAQGLGRGVSLEELWKTPCPSVGPFLHTPSWLA